MRTYEKTHPWISFQIDLSLARPRFWLLLGEAASKCEHIAGTPLRADAAERLHLLYLAKSAQATTAIEGNTLSEEEVRQRISGNSSLPPSREYLGKEVDNIIKACAEIVKQLREGDDKLTPQRILEFNQWVLENLELQEGVVAGKVRTHPVSVGDAYLGAPAEDCEFLLNKLCDWLNADALDEQKDLKIAYAIIKAILAHIYIAWVHPFGDGNGRTARLIEFQMLLAAGVPTPAAHLLSNHYNLTRLEYTRQLRATSKSGGDLLPFLEYAIQGFVDGLREQLATIRAQQATIAWENYVHEAFLGKSSKSAHRQENLVLDLTKSEKPVPPTMLPNLSPNLAREYAGRTRRTLLRDLDALIEMGLIDRTSEGVRAKKETIQAFLPWRKGPSKGK